ncbi:MAG: glycosyltransferase [Desulfobacula sp.]|jgi:UDP-N-acetylglucosamine 2-epimerase|nr:glycosyltransferase [Desulfobacula sp.]
MTDFWKNKKIIAYIALQHHTRFITPVMENLKSKGATIKYIVGQAERSQEITAIELGLTYSHIFDFVTAKDHDEILKNYHLLVAAFSGSLQNDFLLGILPVTVTDKTLFSTATEYTGFKNLLKKEKPDLCFALHEINRWGKMFAFWAKKENIPFISLQEGLSYGLDFGYSGHAQYSTLNLVWGKRIKKKLVSFEAPESKIIPVGNTHLAKEIAHQTHKKIRAIKRKQYKISKKFITLLILSAQLPVTDIFKPIFKAVSENNNQKIFIKFHPACKKNQVDKWTHEITSRFKNNSFFIHAQESTYDLISMADVVVLGQKSTTGLETLAFGKPLVKLDFAYVPNAPHSFVDQGVALKMKAEEFAGYLLKKTDFSNLMDQEKINQYLKNELTDTTTVINKVCTLFQKTIQANKTRSIPIPIIPQDYEKKWSIIIQVPDNPDLFLAQLEAVAVNSQNGYGYETLILVPDNSSPPMQEILDSLEGDIKLIPVARGQNKIDVMNKALETATGENLIFLEKNLAPLKGWLKILDKGFSTHGDNKIFGARISDKEGKIANTGVVVDHNHTPVCAYQHLDFNFPSALKERSFQMVDYFLAVKKELFFQVGGFNPGSGAYMFLDFCLKTRQYKSDPNAIIYLPDLKMIFLTQTPKKTNTDHATYFYGKWNGVLWESEKKLQKEDNVSPNDLTHARLSSAMKTAR